AEAVRPEDVDVAWPDAGDELQALRAKAVLWLRRAAEAAISRYEINDGVALLQRALELESDRRELARLWRRIGRAHALQFDGDAFIEAMQRALELGDDPEERADVYADLAFQTASRSGMWQRRPAGEL